MISYKKIGHFGRLGNQMFQFASTYGIANKLGYDAAFPIENIEVPSIEQFKDGVTREVYFDLPRIFNLDENVIKPLDEIKTKYQAQEPHFHFSNKLFTIPDECDLGGYYQSEKYFIHCQEDVRRLFTFKKEIVNEAKEKFPKLEYETISIHMRVGDYAGLQDHHPICKPEYYFKSTNHFLDKNYYFLIFSDDIQYSKNIFGQSENILYIDGNTAEVDMCMMSMCNHNIVANSSFSWWAAWLNSNENKKVVAPKKWFGSAYYFQNTKDLYPESWIIE
jgi:hypothetical protein